MRMEDREVDIQVTNRCNLSCPHCIYSSNKNGKHMPLNMMMNIIPSLKTLGCKTIHLTGGEPLTHPQLLEFINQVKNNHLNVRLQTNGFLLKKNISKLIEVGVSDFLISIDGLEDYHDNFRGKRGLYNKCWEAIEELKRYDTTVRVNSAICKDNIDQIYALSQILNEYHVNYHSYFYLTPLGRGATMKEKILSPLEWYHFYKATIEKKYNGNMRIKVQKAFVDINHERQSLCRLIKKNSIHVSVDGNVYPCVFLIDTDESMGNLNEKKLEEIWNNTKKWDKIGDNIKSKMCPYKNANCRHGCYGFSYQLRNSFENCDPRCGGADIVPNCIRTYEIQQEKGD